MALFYWIAGPANMAKGGGATERGQAKVDLFTLKQFAWQIISCQCNLCENVTLTEMTLQE